MITLDPCYFRTKAELWFEDYFSFGQRLSGFRLPEQSSSHFRADVLSRRIRYAGLLEIRRRGYYVRNAGDIEMRQFKRPVRLDAETIKMDIELEGTCRHFAAGVIEAVVLERQSPSHWNS
jgi:hypothetical protein